MTWGFGKVILFGEHAVVFGYPALACAIDRRVTCQVAQQTTRPILTLADWDLRVGLSDDHPVAKAWAAIVNAFGGNAGRWSLRGHSTLPAQAGLGSSAALALALTRALAAAENHPLHHADLARIANRAETVFHHNPSGLDLAIAIHGGHALFTRSGGIEPFDAPPLPLAIGVSGPGQPTRELVAKVAALRQSRPQQTNKLLASLGELATAAKPLLSQSNLPAIGSAMRRAHAYLRQLGVSANSLDELAAIGEQAGAYGCKMTGAGGGGAVIAVAETPHAICRAWQRAGYRTLICQGGACP